MIFEAKKQSFIFESNDRFLKRLALFLFSLAMWWLSEHFLRPFCGDTIQHARDYFGNGLFIENVFSQSLPTDILCFLMLIVFCKAKIIPWPKLRAPFSKVAKEGALWGLLICIPTIPLGLYLGFKLGFAPNWQSILGNIISNSYEELTYRVFLFSVAAYTFRNIGAGVVISAVLFASIHTQYPISMQIIVGLAAIFFSVAYIRSSSILSALCAHQLSDMILDSILL